MADEKKLDGKAIADRILEEMKEEVQKLQAEKHITPGLAVVIVGNRTDSQTYVRMKKQAAEKLGFKFLLKELPADIKQEELLQVVKELNNDKDIHGLIVQLPLPAHIDEKTVLDAVSYEKDVDGFHPLNIGALCMKGREPRFVPCTPKGVMELLARSGISVQGKHVVVLGRSNIVGIPVAMLCLHANATVQVIRA